METDTHVTHGPVHYQVNSQRLRLITEKRTSHLNNILQYKDPGQAYTAQDRLKVRAEIRDILGQLADIAPAFDDDDKAEAYRILGPLYSDYEEDASSLKILDATTIYQQYLLVLSIRRKVLERDNLIRHDASARDLTSLVNSLNSLVGLFMRSQDKLKAMQEVQHLKAAVSSALKDAPEDVRNRFMQTMKATPVEGFDLL